MRFSFLKETKDLQAQFAPVVLATPDADAVCT